MNELTVEEKLKLVRSLFERKPVDKDAFDRFREKFPKASEQIIRTMTHHLYVDGHIALLDMLCELEMFLRQEIEEIGYGKISEIVYHLNNFVLLESIMPETAQDVVDSISEIEVELKDDKPDVKAALSMLAELKEFVEGHADMPDIC